MCCAEACAIVFGLLDKSPKESWVHATVVGWSICLCARHVARPSMFPAAKCFGVNAIRNVDCIRVRAVWPWTALRAKDFMVPGVHAPRQVMTALSSAVRRDDWRFLRSSF